MEKTKVVIASVLKPIDDTRMYEKFGLSLEQANKYEINIIGFASKNIPASEHIRFYPIGSFPRLSFTRLSAPLKVFKIYIKVKPKVIVVNTHELLIVTILYRIIFGAKFLYDIRENYARNVKLQNVYSSILKLPISGWIRFKEYLAAPFVSRHIIAERSYAQELPFLKKNTLLLENKYQAISQETKAPTATPQPGIRLLYSGTIAESSGVFDAIHISKALFELDSSISLTIIGYCAQKKDLLRLKQEISDTHFIELKGGDHLVPHSEIVQEIKRADFGFILNASNPVSDQKLPTRLFEYTANHLPVLCINNPLWIQFLNQFNAGITTDTESLDSIALLSKMKSTSFYNQGDTSSSWWKSEEPKLLELFSGIR